MIRQMPMFWLALLCDESIIAFLADAMIHKIIKNSSHVNTYTDVIATVVVPSAPCIIKQAASLKRTCWSAHWGTAAATVHHLSAAGVFQGSFPVSDQLSTGFHQDLLFPVPDPWFDWLEDNPEPDDCWKDE